MSNNGYHPTGDGHQLYWGAQTEVIQGINDTFGMASVRWLRRRQQLRCRLLHAGHNAFEPATVKTVRQSLKREIVR